MSHAPLKITKPKVFTIEVPAEAETKSRTLQFAIHERDVYLPADVIGAYKADMRELAERCNVRSIMTKEGTHLFPSDWLAAARPECSDDVRAIVAAVKRRF